jgi:hypothetical protein
VGESDEGIVLTDREREALAGLAESIGDPWLARQLAGGDQTPPPPTRRPTRLTRLGQRLQAVTGWVGLLLVVLGAMLAVTTFVHSTALASLGLAMMGFGLWRLALDQGANLIRRLTERRTPAPPPPGVGPDRTGG